MNNWNAIFKFYEDANDAILAAPRNEWGVWAYSWQSNGRSPINFTPIEDCVWENLRNLNAVMYPQYPVNNCFLDFANPVAQVAIECDGAAYHTDHEKDMLRDKALRLLGWTVYRMPGWMCIQQFDEESGNDAEGMRFVREICERHGLVRTGGSSEWVRVAEALGRHFLEHA